MSEFRVGDRIRTYGGKRAHVLAGGPFGPLRREWWAACGLSVFEFAAGLAPDELPDCRRCARAQAAADRALDSTP